MMTPFRISLLVQKAFIHIHTLSVAWLFALDHKIVGSIMLAFLGILIWSLNEDEPEDAGERRPS